MTKAKYLGIGEVATMFGVSKGLLYKMVQDGDVKALKLRMRFVISQEEVKRLETALQVKPRKKRAGQA